MMVATAKKWAEYNRELNDWFVAISEFQLKKIIRDCRQWLRTSHPEDAAELYSVMGIAYARLNLFEDTLACYQSAEKLNRSSADLKRNVGTTLVSLNRPHEAIPWFLDALNLDDNRRVMTYANLAEACAVMGLYEDALDAFQDAVRAADHASPDDVLILAAQAAELGADRDAIELYARSLALRQGAPLGETDPIEIIRKAPTALKSGLAYLKALRAAIMRAESFEGALEHLQDANIAESLQSTGDTDMETFEATKPYRMRSTAAALITDDNA